MEPRVAALKFVWGATLPLAGHLRIGADNHYLTDVLVGAVVGGAIGVVVPYVFHRPSSAVALGAGPTGFSVAGTF
jgi:membrane-associated phospholipid phosphatase